MFCSVLPDLSDYDATFDGSADISGHLVFHDSSSAHTQLKYSGDPEEQKVHSVGESNAVGGELRQQPCRTRL